MLGKVIIDYQSITAGLHELFADGGTRIRGNILKSGCFIGGSHHNNGMLHRTVTLKNTNCTRNSRLLLTDSNVNTDQILPFLVDNSIDRKGCLTGLAVANDQLTLATSNRDHRIDGFDAGLDGSIDILAQHHTRCNALDWPIAAGDDRSSAIDRFS